jgi:PAS domain S-box-containing protein
MFLTNQPNGQEKMFSIILETLPIAVLHIQDRKIIYANKAVEHVFGFAPHELLDKDTHLLYRTDVEYETIGKQIYEKLETDDIRDEMYPYRRKDGKDIICSVNAAKISDTSHGKQIVISFEDITNRITAEKELSDSEERYRNLLENSHDIIMSISPDGKFIHVNTIWYKSFGYTPQELPALKIENIIQKENQPLFTEQFTKAFQNEPTENLELNFLSKNRETIILEGNLIPKSFYDKVVAIWGFYRDITDQKKAQEEIKKKMQELERFNKIVVDRELKMIELKKTINSLQEQITKQMEIK